MDREPDFAQMVQAKADKLGAGNIRPVTADAETLDAEPGHFELAVIGNAFHRLDRDLVAARLLHWLRPGGCVALCWADAPAARGTGSGSGRSRRCSTGGRPRSARPTGSPRTGPSRSGDGPMPRCCPRPGSRRPGATSSPSSTGGAWRNWPADVRSTSFLPPSVLGDQGAAFDDDLAAAIGPFAAADGTFPHDVSFVYDLARKPTD